MTNQGTQHYLRRRGLLASIGSGILVIGGGCVGDDGNDGSPTNNATNASGDDQTEPTTESSDDSSESFDPDIEYQLRQGQAERKRLEFEPYEATYNGQPVDFEYLADSGEVQITYRYESGSISSVDKMAFERFGPLYANHAIKRDINELLRDQSIDSHGIWPTTVGERGREKYSKLETLPEAETLDYDLKWVPQLRYETIYEDTGYLRHEPETAFEDVIQVIPEAYEIKIQFEREYENEFPVLCERTYIIVSED